MAAQAAKEPDWTDPRGSWIPWFAISVFLYPLLFFGGGALLVWAGVLPAKMAEVDVAVFAGLGLLLWLVVSLALKRTGSWLAVMRPFRYGRGVIQAIIETIARLLVGLLALSAIVAVVGFIVAGVIGVLWFGVQQLL